MSKTPSAIPARLIGNGGKPIDQAEKQPAPRVCGKDRCSKRCIHIRGRHRHEADL